MNRFCPRVAAVDGQSQAHRVCPRVTTLGLTACLAIAILAVPASAEVPKKPDIPGVRNVDYNKNAILIGVEEYKYLPSLRYTTNDVEVMRDTLLDRGGFHYDQITRFIDSEEWGTTSPTRKGIMDRLPHLLKNLKPESEVILYFSGHGYQDDDGTMYLCPGDINPDQPAETGIPVTWLREQLAACKAGFKLLVLDACHAGSEKGDDDVKAPSSKDLGETFRDLTGVVTLASSTADEKSLLWDEKNQSLFSYWFAQGLKGHADENGDTAVDIDELNKYVHRNVTHVAKSRFSRSQTPVRIIRSGAPGGAPVVVNLRPRGLEEVLTDMADQLAWAIDDRKLDNVAVLEFAADTPVGELLGVDFGLLGKHCAGRIEGRLTGMSYNRYTVLDSKRLVKALTDLEFSIDDLASDERLDDLSETMGSVPVLALGTLRNRVGRAVTLQCKLVDAKTGGMAASAGGLALLTESEWAMLGRSVHRKERPTPSYAPQGTSDDEPQEDEIDKLDEESQGPHPFLDPSFPFPVRIVIDGEERRGIFHGNDYYVPVRQGEVYSIEVASRERDPVIMRLLVDGLNTLPEKSREKGVSTYEVAPRVSLEDARFWVLDPKKNRQRRWAVRGFFTATGKGGSLREFKIVDLEESVAARRQFTDQVGLITAAFYAPRQQPDFSTNDLTFGAAQPGTGFGDERQEDTEERKNMEIDYLRSVVHIRYVDADALVEMQRQWASEEAGG